MTHEMPEDEREEELSSLQAIYPELETVHGEHLTASLQLEVAPTNKLPVTFALPPRGPTYALPTPPSSDGANGTADKLPDIPPAVDTHELEYLPSLQLNIVLPPDYPAHSPPVVTLHTYPSWVPDDVILRLNLMCEKLWEEYGQGQVLFTYIDYLQQEAEHAFHVPAQQLHFQHDLKAPLLTFSRNQALAKFNAETFDCSICLEPKKGSSCYRLQKCHHVFCVGCLQDFYNSAITEGDVTNVKCLAPDCGKRGNRQHTLHPTELLQIPLDRPQVQRYVDLKLKKKLDSDKTTIFCPRTFCQAPARSPRYAKYITTDLENYPDSSDDEDDTSTQDNPQQEPKASPIDTDRLRICSACSYAFCRTCARSWHGDLLHCRPPKSTDPGSMSAEDAASYDYIRANTSPCPTCSSPAQKTHGCNHMICYTCNTHFCYLCSSWLHAGNPYSHFNNKNSTCFMRLWELEDGDEGAAEGGQPNAVFAGARAAEQAALFAAMLNDGVEPAEEAPARDADVMRLPPDAVLIVPAPAPNPPPAAAAAAPQRQQNAQQNAAAQHRRPRAPDPGLQRFLALAANDEEDGWDSDEMDEEDFLAFEIAELNRNRGAAMRHRWPGGQGRVGQWDG